MSQFWFKKRTSVTDFGRPANWKGWAAVILFIFIFALIMQMIGAWAFGGFPQSPIKNDNALVKKYISEKNSRGNKTAST